MALNDPRVQLLANLKCLYGSDVEVLTLCVDNFRDKYQAVAMSFNPFTATWTKFLHSEPNCTSTRDAIETLLKESERDLAKLLSVNGNTVPFQGIMVQTLTLRRGQWRDSSAGSSVRSEFVFVATPGSTLSDTVPDGSVHGEHPIEEIASKEPSVVDEAPVDKASVEEAIVETVNEKPLAEQPISVSEEPVPLYVEPEPVSQESETISLDWSPRNISKKGRSKKKARFTFNESYPAEEYPTEVPAEEPPAEARVEESRVEGELPTEKVCYAYDIIGEVLACHPEPNAPPPEDDFAWGLLTATKKDKKKKGRKSIEKGMSTPPTEPEPAPEDFGWVSSLAPKKKKKGKTLTEEEKIFSPEPVRESVDDFGWGAFGTSKKMKGKTLTEEGKLPPPELDPVSDLVAEFEEPKLDAPPPATSPPPSPPPSEFQPRIGDGVWETLRPGAPLPSESPQVAQTRQTIVFTIQFPNEISSKPLQVMTTIADNSLTAIIDTVNSYLDSKSMLNGIHGQRKLEIKYGVGRNGDVDLSTLEETMWPKYLDYFRQYTKIPELTVNVMDG